jgi:hypothetical protein
MRGNGDAPTRRRDAGLGKRVRWLTALVPFRSVSSLRRLEDGTRTCVRVSVVRGGRGSVAALCMHIRFALRVTRRISAGLVTGRAGRTAASSIWAKVGPARVRPLLSEFRGVSVEPFFARTRSFWTFDFLVRSVGAQQCGCRCLMEVCGYGRPSTVIVHRASWVERSPTRTGCPAVPR